jgi:threonine/homoserine/homoserine lactone efflux protein
MSADLHFLVYLLPGITFGFAAAVQPGPLALYLISQTLRTGLRKTMPAIFSPLVTDGPIAVLCLFILSKLPLNLIQYIQLAGGVFILYLAFRALVAWKNFSETVTIPGPSSRRTFFNAVVVNFLNPGPYLGWSLVIGPLFLKGWKINPVDGIVLLAGFYLTIIIVMAAMILLFHLARERGPRLQRALIGLSSIFLALFGIYQLVTGGLALWIR